MDLQITLMKEKNRLNDVFVCLWRYIDIYLMEVRNEKRSTNRTCKVRYMW